MINNKKWDYLVPAIKRIKKGESHIDVFEGISKQFNITYQTVSAQCTRHIGLSTEDFLNKILNGQIINHLEKKFPNEREFIVKEFGILLC